MTTVVEMAMHATLERPRRVGDEMRTPSLN
jgi:hypothetical protein